MRDNLLPISRYQASENLPYFRTITVLDWTSVLIEARYIDPIVDSLQFSRANNGLQLFAFVVMPNHLHLICAAGDDAPRGERATREGIPAMEGARKDFRTSDSRTSDSRTSDLHAMMRDFKRFMSRTIHDRLVADGRATVLEWLERAAQRGIQSVAVLPRTSHKAFHHGRGILPRVVLRRLSG